MKPQITITIDGRQGSGKSTLAQYLADHLQSQHGVKCVLNDDGGQRKVDRNGADLPNHFDADVTFNVVQK